MTTTSKTAALLNLATTMAEAAEAGAPQTATFTASLPRFIEMVRPHDAALADRLAQFA